MLKTGRGVGRAVALTLVPYSHARVGARFTFQGPNREEPCTSCPLTKLCFGLEPGTPYEVTAIRGVTHPCGLHDEGRVHVVEVAPTDFATSLETRHLRGTAATWNPVPCGYAECPHNARCHPVGPAPGTRYTIVADEGSMDCPMGYALHAVRLQP